MFGGLGKIIGGALNAVGLGKIAPFVSLAVNALSGNWMGVAQDVLSLASRFSNNSFLNKVAKFAPLGNFASGGGFNFGNILKNGRITDLFSNFKSLMGGFDALRSGDVLGGGQKIFKAFEAIKDFTEDQNLLSERVSYSQSSFSFGARV